MDLSSCTALVTGASRGIGAATVRALAAAGCATFLLARSQEALAALADEVGGRALPADVSDADSLGRVLGELQAELGGCPDIVVNAAGVFGLSALASTPLADFDRHYAVNLRGAFLVIRTLLPGMLKRGTGRIINVGSVAGRKAFPQNGAYSASKFGLRGMHEVLLEELRGTGVGATLLEPAACDTQLWDALDPDEDPHLPNRVDMLQPSDVADAIVFAASRPPGAGIPLLQIEHG